MQMYMSSPLYIDLLYVRICIYIIPILISYIAIICIMLLILFKYNILLVLLGKPTFSFASKLMFCINFFF